MDPAAGAAPDYLEVWITDPAKNNCAGCIYLEEVGPFAPHTCPRPKLHDHCGCRVERIAGAAYSADRWAHLVAVAERNSRARAQIETIARVLSGERTLAAAGVVIGGAALLGAGLTIREAREIRHTAGEARRREHKQEQRRRRLIRRQR